MRPPAGPRFRRAALAAGAVLPILLLGACRATAPAAPPPEIGRGAAGVDVPVPALLSIGEVQGRTARSARIDQQVSVQGVVAGESLAGPSGVFLQSEQGDGDPLTSDGLFVEHAAKALPRLHIGDLVRVSGRVAERGDDDASLTMLRDTVVQVVGQGHVTPTTIAGPPAAVADWERYEGMAIALAVPLTVSGNDGLSGYGEITASFGGRLFQPTELAEPGPAAQALAADVARRTLLLEDGRDSATPANLWFLPDPLDDAHPLRCGSRLETVAGVLDQRRGQYRLRLSQPIRLRQQPRPPAPTVAGDVRIASLNLLNLFNGDGRGGGFPTERGAETGEQYRRQQQKLVAVVQALAPDIAALMEVENDGSDAESTLAQFAAALNAAGPIRDYRIVATGARLGDDAIRVAMIYRASRIRAQGPPAMLTGGPFAGHSRVSLAQAFRAGAGPVFVLAANHFKSKGCGHAPDQARGAEADQGDGQGCWNPVRVESARRLLVWLDGDPTRAGAAALRLIVGDLNAYAMEDPVRLLRAAGWRDAFAPSHAAQPYSFVFAGLAGRLDHALLDPAMATRLRGAVEWHNNSDEAESFDYRAAAAAGPYRASDHDPILLGFELRRQPL